jgi:serine/threonine protein kinase
LCRNVFQKGTSTVSERNGQQFGSYRLTHLLDTGNIAEIYLGKHVNLGTQALLKILAQDSMMPDEQAIFARDLARLARLVHPHIVPLLEYGFQAGLPFLALEYFQAGNLRDAHPRGLRLPLDSVITYALQIGEALQFVHDQQLLHGYLRPENLWLGAHKEMLVSDTGLVLALESTRGQNKQEASGSAHYLAPEQIMGRVYPASDQYALGIVIYEWLCGVPPFRGSFTEIGARHMLAAPPSLLERRPDLPAEVVDVVERALGKKPEERFASIYEFVLALATAGQTSEQRASEPVSPPEQTPRSGRAPSSAFGNRKAGKTAMLGRRKRPPTSPLPALAGKRSPTSPLPSLNGNRPPTSPLPSLNGKRSPTSPLPSLSNTRPATSPLPAVNSAQGSTLPPPVPISLQRAYEIFCAQVALSEPAEQKTGALVIRLPQEQVGQRVYLQSETSWQAHPYKHQQEAEVYRRAVQGNSLTAAVFRNLTANAYFVWTAREEPHQLLIVPGQTTLLDFTHSEPLSNNTETASEKTLTSAQRISVECAILLGLALLGALMGALIGLIVQQSITGALFGGLCLVFLGLVRISRKYVLA